MKPNKPDFTRKVTDAGWAAARAKYEADPRYSPRALAAELGCTRQRVAAKAQADGWVKASPLDARRLAEAAQLKADQAQPPAIIDLAPIEASGPNAKAHAETDPDMLAEQTKAAIDARAQVVARHRSEWRVVRGLLQEAIRARDYGKGKLAKIAAETLKITQDAERRAFGLDVAEAPPSGAEAVIRVVVERELGVLPNAG